MSGCGRMIDERELLRWLESHKILSKTYVPGETGETYYGISFVALRRQIREMTGGEENDTETKTKGEEGQPILFLQR